MVADNNQEYFIGLDKKIDMVRKSVRAVTRGLKTSRLITGTAGIGKSYAVLSELKDEEANFVRISGGITDAASLYRVLCDNNSEDKIIVFDDVNTILTHKDCREILRIAVENVKERQITYASNKIVRGKVFHKPKTNFYSKIIIITNLPRRKIEDGILSRTSPIEIICNAEEVFEWVGINIEEAPPKKVPLEWKMDVYNFIREKIVLEKKLSKFDFRTFEDAMLWYASCVDNKTNEVTNNEWREFVYTLCT